MFMNSIAIMQSRLFLAALSLLLTTHPLLAQTPAAPPANAAPPVAAPVVRRQLQAVRVSVRWSSYAGQFRAVV